MTDATSYLLSCIGQRRAVKHQYFKVRFGMQKGVFNALVDSLRDEGNQICSGNEGYYVAETNEEWADWLERYYNRGMTIVERACRWRNFDKLTINLPIFGG